MPHASRRTARFSLPTSSRLIPSKHSVHATAGTKSSCVRPADAFTDHHVGTHWRHAKECLTGGQAVGVTAIHRARYDLRKNAHAVGGVPDQKRGMLSPASLRGIRARVSFIQHTVVAKPRGRTRSGMTTVPH